MKTLTLLAALALGTAASAHEYTLGALQIVHPVMTRPLAAGGSAAGYLSITNTGTADATLTGVAADFAAQSMVHRSDTDANGVTSMTDIPELAIPAGETVTLAPGGMHVMFMGVTGSFAEGDMMPATLSFGALGSLEVEFKVEKPGATEKHQHKHGTDSSGG